MDLRRVRAPRDNEAVLVPPPVARVCELIAINQRRLTGSKLDLFGKDLQQLRSEARHSLVVAARNYLRLQGEPIPPDHEGPLLLAGHQPEFFHPGVWVKNFALQGLARRHQLTPINLIVDNDTVKATVLRLPAGIGSASNVHIVALPFDSGNDESPYEDRPVHDKD